MRATELVQVYLHLVTLKVNDWHLRSCGSWHRNRLPFRSRVGCCKESAICFLDPLGDRQRAGKFERVSHFFQVSGGVVRRVLVIGNRQPNSAQIRFMDHNVWPPLLVNSGGRDRCVNRLAQVNASNNVLQGCIDNLRATGGTARQERRAILSENDGRAHARKWSFVRGDSVRFGANETERIRDTGRDAEVIHLIVEHDTGTRDHHLATPSRIDGRSQRDPVSQSIGGR